jgi:hypothetical protein
VTLGPKEAEELRDLIHILQEEGGVRDFLFWGRSMGAVATILFLNWYTNQLKAFFELKKEE